MAILDASEFRVLEPSGGRRRRASVDRRRRGLLALMAALAVHGAMLMMFIGRRPGLVQRTWTMEMVLVDADGAPAGARQGGLQKAGSGGRDAEGDQALDGADSTLSGDAAVSPSGGRAAPAREASIAKTLSTQAGEAAQSQAGEGDVSADGASRAASENTYQRLLQKHIRPYRLYPSEAVSRRAEGTVTVRFRVGRDGDVQEAWVVGRSRDPALDRAALETLWRAEPLPGVPAELPAPVEVELPMPFRLPGR